MSYKAKVTTLRTYEHPNADRIQLANAGGYQVIVSLDTKEDELGLFFQTDGQLSNDFASINDLIGYKDELGNRKGGFFGKNRRVKLQRFRGQKSEGFWIPISSLESFGDTSKLREGDLLDTFNGVTICNKYITPATLKAQRGGTPHLRRRNSYLHKHKDTAQFRDEGRFIPVGSLITVTEKLHGTSARVGKVLDDVETGMKWYQKAIRILQRKPKMEPTCIVGSRNVLLVDPDREYFYGKEASDLNFRQQSAGKFKDLLHENEVVYYEIVGYTNKGESIMGSHGLTEPESKHLKKQYGDVLEFSYGCANGNWDEYVYRITNVSPEGNEYDLSDAMMRRRCVELGLKPVPEIESIPPFIYDGDIEKLTEMLVSPELLDVPSRIDDRHISEGIAIRVDNYDGVKFLKIKSFDFCVLEGIQKSFIGYVDTEEIS